MVVLRELGSDGAIIALALPVVKRGTAEGSGPVSRRFPLQNAGALAAIGRMDRRREEDREDRTDRPSRATDPSRLWRRGYGTP